MNSRSNAPRSISTAGEYLVLDDPRVKKHLTRIMDMCNQLIASHGSLKAANVMGPKAWKRLESTKNLLQNIKVGLTQKVFWDEYTSFIKSENLSTDLQAFENSSTILHDTILRFICSVAFLLDLY